MSGATNPPNTTPHASNTTNCETYGSSFSAESIKVIAESVGVPSLADDAAKELAEDVTRKLKAILQDAKKFMLHSASECLAPSDIDQALRVRNIEPHYGFKCNEFIPFRFASGGGRELHFTDERDISIKDMLAAPPPKLPPDTTVHSHWLVVDGIQPTIPENPPPMSREAQALAATNPVAHLNIKITKETLGKPTTGKMHKFRSSETVHVKQLATHELSVEQQLYYKGITEACVGSDESRRNEALQSLACDPGLYEMLPRMCTFISEGVKVNVVQNNLALLIYLMRMVKALMDNNTLYLEKYLHELVPSVITCIVSKQLCMRPELDNHWALRDFASRLVAQMCKTFNTTTNNLQTRVTRIFAKSFENDKMPLTTLYGSIAGLAEMGSEVIRVIIIPKLRFIADRLEAHLVGNGQSNTDRTAAGHIRTTLQKYCPYVLKQIRNPPDLVEEYKQDYGFLGPLLCAAVIKARNAPTYMPTSTSTTSLVSASTSASIQSAAQSATGRPLALTPTTLTQGPRQSHTLTNSVPQLRILQQPTSVNTRFLMTANNNASSQQQQQQQQLEMPGASKQILQPQKSGENRKSMPPLEPVSTTTTASLVMPILQNTNKYTNASLGGYSIINMNNNNNNNNNNSSNNDNMNKSNSSNIGVITIGQKNLGNNNNNSNNNNTNMIGRNINRNMVGQQQQQQQQHEGMEISDDSNSIIIETERVLPPPELDDLSHLE